MDPTNVSLTIFLMKSTAEDFQSCLKNPDNLITVEIKKKYHMDAKIYYCNSKKQVPQWMDLLNEFANQNIEIEENVSNKAVMLIKIDSRIMALVFGYGRSLIKEEQIERNFGLKVALNTINPNKMRSINAATIEDMVVNTQRQASYSTSQEEFDLNTSNDIMQGVTGEPYKECYGTHISGKDSLVVSANMRFEDLVEKLKLYHKAFKAERYKHIGFEWIDNVTEVRDSNCIKDLNNQLVLAIEKHDLRNMHIAPPETIDWSQIIGFCYSGIGLNINDQEAYSLDLDLQDYVEKIRPGIKIYEKIKHDRLMAIMGAGIPYPMCSIYNALTYQVSHEDKTFILCAGSWYQINQPFFEQVNTYVKTRIKLADIVLPACSKNMPEGSYNEMAVSHNSDFCLMDQKMIQVENGPKKIEACDIFTTEKQFVHVKKKSQSSQLSHLFSQGKVSAECFVSDEKFRKQVSEIVCQKFGRKIFDYTQKPMTNEYEVVYAIIDNEGATVESLPFFSKVNLMITARELEKMHFKYSLCFIKKEM